MIATLVGLGILFVVAGVGGQLTIGLPTMHIGGGAGAVMIVLGILL